MCGSVAIGVILNLGIQLDVFFYARRLESNLTYSSICGDIVLFIIRPVFFNVINKKTDVTIMIKCNILNVIGVCFVSNQGSLSCQIMCFRKQALAVVVQVKIRDVLMHNGRLFFFFFFSKVRAKFAN